MRPRWLVLGSIAVALTLAASSYLIPRLGTTSVRRPQEAYSSATGRDRLDPPHETAHAARRPSPQSLRDESDTGGTPNSIRATPRELYSHTDACPRGSLGLVNVRDFNAAGNGRADDTKAIQSAIDSVAARGGGTVFFPPGAYLVQTLRQDSCVDLSGNGYATLKQSTAASDRSVVEGRVRETRGSIQQGSKRLAVQDASAIREGALVGVRAAGGPSNAQRTELAESADTVLNRITLRTTWGLPRNRTNYLFVGREIVSYNGIRGNTLLGVQRGLFGTQATIHVAGTPVAQASRLVARVVSVSAHEVELDRQALASVTLTLVSIGSVGMAVRGMTIDNNERGSHGSDVLLRYQLARSVRVEDSTFKNGSHGGLSLDDGTMESIVLRNKFVNNGDADDRRGAAIWLFAGAKKNSIRDNDVSGSGFIGVMIDNRSSAATEFDADSSGNEVNSNRIAVPHSSKSGWNAGIVIESSSHNEIKGNDVRSARNGIIVAKTSQSPIATDAVVNSVDDNYFSFHDFGIVVSGSDNEFVGNTIRHTGAATNDNGRNNRFADNSIE